MKSRSVLMALGLLLVLFCYTIAQAPYMINHQESLIKAPSVQVQGDEMALSGYFTPPNEIAGYTYSDAQHKNSMRRQIVIGTDGIIHFTWMDLVGNDTTNNRYADYNARYAFNSWLVPGGMHITSALSRGGYTGLDLLPDNREVIAYHRELPTVDWSFWATTISIEKLTPGFGQFNQFDIPDSCAGSAGKGVWPTVACSKAASGDSNFIHLSMVEGGTDAGERDLAYVRCFEKPSNHDTLVCQSPGWGAPLLIPKNTRLAPNKIPFQFASSRLTGAAVATSPVSQKVAVVWLQNSGTDSTQNEVKYLESSNNGANWIATGNMGTPVQVTSYSTAGYVDRAYPDVAVVYDYSDVLHIIWTTFKSTDQNDVSLWHWSSGTGIRKISSITALSSLDPGSNNLLIAKPTLGVESNPGDPTYNYLYCVYTGFKDGDTSAAGYANGDLYLQASSNSGLSWGPVVNTTNSHTNGCVAPACSSEHWSSVAERVDGFLHISYVLDHNAGTATDGEGTFTLNEFSYIPYPCPSVPVESIPFAPAVIYDTGSNNVSVFCADLDGDSDLDLAAGDYDDQRVSILKNNGYGTFQAPVTYYTGGANYSVFCADLDGDSDLDLAVADWSSPYVSILKNNGDGTFQSEVNYGVGYDPVSIFCANLDGDTDLDLAVAIPSDDSVSILKNNGNGTFYGPFIYAAGDNPRSVFCADLDGDSYLDLAVANSDGDNISILKNNGSGNFPTAVNYGAGDYPRSVFCADLDGDSDLDLAVANRDGNNVSILKNNGDGTFQTAVNYGAGDGPFSVFCADLDGDSDLDLAVANSRANNVSILRNNGDGTFQTGGSYYTAGHPYSVFCADLDGDTDLDLAVGTLYSGSVSILLNLTISLIPSAFSLISPEDLDSVKTPLNFVWQASTVSNPDDTIRYDLYLSRSIVFNPDSTVVYDSLLNATLTDSLDLKLWYWKVKAYDKLGMERWSDQTWSFYVYLCGDDNGDGKITVSDVVYEINYLFKGGIAPKPVIAGDVNCDGKDSVSDVVYLINYLFKGGPKPCKNCP